MGAFRELLAREANKAYIVAYEIVPLTYFTQGIFAKGLSRSQIVQLNYDYIAQRRVL
eukprot:UN06749